MEKKRYHIVIASLAFAVLTWVSVNLQAEYIIVKRVPIILENMREGKALKYSIPKTINLRFRGNGWSLAGLYLLPDLNYFIDMSSITTKDYLITEKDMMEHIKVPFSLQPLDVQPETLILAIDNYSQKRIPVIGNIMTNYKEGYGQVGDIRINPDSVVIGGSRNLIETINSWPTVYKRFDDVHASVDMNVSLEEPMNYSVELLQNTVQLLIDVQPFAEKTISGIPIVATGTPQNREVIFIPSRIDIIIRGGIEQLAKLSNEDFKVTVAYQNLTQDSVETVVPQIDSPPEAKIINRTPSQFKFIIRKKL